MVGIPYSISAWQKLTLFRFGRIFLNRLCRLILSGISQKFICKIYIKIMLIHICFCSLNRGRLYAIFLRRYLSFYWMEMRQFSYFKFLFKYICLSIFVLYYPPGVAVELSLFWFTDHCKIEFNSKKCTIHRNCRYIKVLFPKNAG